MCVWTSCLARISLICSRNSRTPGLQDSIEDVAKNVKFSKFWFVQKSCLWIWGLARILLVSHWEHIQNYYLSLLCHFWDFSKSWNSWVFGVFFSLFVEGVSLVNINNFGPHQKNMNPHIKIWDDVLGSHFIFIVWGVMTNYVSPRIQSCGDVNFTVFTLVCPRKLRKKKCK